MNGRMTIWGLLSNIWLFVKPYRALIGVTLVLTLVGSLMAQVNAVVLDRAVDAINALLQVPGGFSWRSAARILTVISIILLGKEVIGALVTFFQRYYGERMRLDGVELSEWDTQWLRENVGLVLQKNHIFDGSIEDNIRYGCPTATHDDVVRAARQAYILDQIQQLPLGFDTPALQLSGGQQQRIAIERMFLKNPPIIFLDEPTASLDAIATEQIKASIDAIKAGRTVIIISHNIGQIIDADQIYILQHGRVVQSGTPDEVYHQGGLYKDIFDASARSMNVDKIASTLV